ncbi:MAG: hypothetical protein HYU68_00350 [Bacteroidetes bacterium]|nr:hypothetical protein [Bacteroidota bacterium]
MKSTIIKQFFFLYLFGLFCTLLFSQNIEKIEKVNPIKILNLTSGLEDKYSFIKENKTYRFVDFSHVVDNIPNKEGTKTSEFDIIRRGEVSRLASRSLYDMVMIIK